VRAVGRADVAGRAADQAHHHRFDHGQRELGGDRGVDRIAARRQHLDTGGGRERMVGHDHAARAAGGRLLANMSRAGAGAPIFRGHGFSGRDCGVAIL